jgi:hypothetical protein
MNRSENPYLQIADIVSDTFNRLSDDHLEIIFEIKLSDKTEKERDIIIAYCKNEWDHLSWNEIMQHLNDIFN